MDSTKFQWHEGKKLRRKVRAIIVNEEGNFLLIQPIHYKSDKWSFVGGGIEEGESIEQALRREVAEEVGIKTIHSLRIAKFQHSYLYPPEVRAKNASSYDGMMASFVWVVVPSGEDVSVQTSEIKGFRWVPLSEMSHYVKVRQQLEAFEAVYAELLTPARAA